MFPVNKQVSSDCQNKKLLLCRICTKFVGLPETDECCSVCFKKKQLSTTGGPNGSLNNNSDVEQLSHQNNTLINSLLPGVFENKVDSNPTGEKISYSAQLANVGQDNEFYTINDNLDVPKKIINDSLVLLNKDDKNKNACSICAKRLKLVKFDCKCGEVFCSRHRLPEEHDCSYDFRTEGRMLLQKKNVLVTGKKMNYLED
jgi:hypothetical protein